MIGNYRKRLKMTSRKYISCVTHFNHQKIYIYINQQPQMSNRIPFPDALR